MALRAAYDHAQEYSLPAPDVATGQLLTTLAAVSTAHGVEKPQAIAITPAASVAGLYLLHGLPDSGILSCIDPEAEHQASAKAAFRTAGYKPAHMRFLPSRPLDVIDRLAPESYQVIYVDVPILDTLAVTKACWPLLRPGGTIVLANVLLDGTLADSSRTDRSTNAARELDSYVDEIHHALVTRLPLGAGTTLLSKR
nr:class I SAM-dependent methyltransferase [Corynebacterium phocae]